MRVKTFPLIAAMLFVSSAAAADRQLPGHVLRIIDGDSLVLTVNGAQYRVELATIDAPELNQPWGMAAADSLHRTLTGRFVVVNSEGPSAQLTGEIIFRGRDVALDLVADGLAWALPGAADDPKTAVFTAAEDIARQQKRGLWSDDEPIAPWDWRAGPAR